MCVLTPLNLYLVFICKVTFFAAHENAVFSGMQKFLGASRETFQHSLVADQVLQMVEDIAVEYVRRFRVLMYYYIKEGLREYAK